MIKNNNDKESTTFIVKMRIHANLKRFKTTQWDPCIKQQNVSPHEFKMEKTVKKEIHWNTKLLHIQLQIFPDYSW